MKFDEAATPKGNEVPRMHEQGNDSAATRVRRSAMFARSDISNAAWDFVDAISEHAETIWEPADKDRLAESLTDKAFEIQRDPEAKW